MRKLTVVLIFVLILAGIVAVALLNLSRLVNSNKDFFITRIESETGRQVEVGEIRVTLWGGIGIRVEDVSAMDDPEFSSTSFMEADELQVNVALFPLLKKKLQVKKVTLRKPVMSLVRDQNGRFNFDSLGRPEEVLTGGAGEGQQTSSGRSRFVFLIAMANISEGEVRFVDRVSDSEFHIKNIDLSVEDVQMDRPFSARLKAAFLAGVEGGEQQNLEIAGQIGPVGESLQPSSIPVNFDLEIDPVSLAEARGIELLSKFFPKELVLEGPLRAEAHIEGKLEALSLNSRIEMTDCGIDLADRFRKPAGIPLRLESETLLSGQTVKIERSIVQIHKLDVSGSGSAILGESPSVNLVLRSEGTDLSGWEVLVPKIEPYAAAGKTDLVLDVEGTIEPGTLPPVKGQMLLKEASIHLPRAPKPARDIGGKLEFHTEGKKIVLDRVDLSWLGGTVKGMGLFDLRTDPPAFELDTQVHEVNLLELLSSTLANVKERFQGTVNLDLKIGGRGTKWEDIRTTIDGSGKMAVSQGTILDMNIAKNIFESINAELGSLEFISDHLRQTYPRVFSAEKTVFKELQGDILIRKGRVFATNLLLGVEDYAIFGGGSMGFDGMVDSKGTFILSPRLSKDLIDAVSYASSLADDQGRVEIPFSLSGTIPKVALYTDIGGKIKKSVITPEVDKLKKKLLDKFLPSKKSKDGK